MNRQRLIGAVLAATLVTAAAAAAAAQEEPPTTPEGVSWTLTSYLDSGTAEMVSVPLGTEATLLLQDGVASGAAGCNQFSGSYQIDGSSLTFGEAMSVTLALCEEGVQAIEDAYLNALSQVDGWIIDAGMLELSDSFGNIILTFEVPDIMFTASQATSLTSTLESLGTTLDGLTADLLKLRGEVDAQNVVKLRQRIKALESENEKITKRLDALENQPKSSTSSGSGGANAFTSAEKVLLEGIPGRIEKYCTPLRSTLPKNTKAAVQCKPNTNTVANINYYLLEGERAAAAFRDEMSTYNVPQATSDTQTCAQGVKSQRQWVGGGWQADGCYRTNQRAEVRFIDNATECRKLKVGGKTLQSPAIYMAVQGTNTDVEAVYSWATKGLDPNSGQLTSLTVPIERPNAALSPSCPQ